VSKFETTRAYLEAVKNDIAQELDRRGMTTTGRAKDSLQVVQARSRKTGRFEANFYLVSIDYLPILYTGVGAKPSRFPPFQKGSALYNWVVNKGLSFTGENGKQLTRAQMSFLIARKIFTEGTRIFRGRPGIPIKAILKDNQEAYLGELKEALAAEIITDWNKAIIAQ